MATRWSDYVRLMRLDRPIGILLLLWPTLWALWFAVIVSAPHAHAFPSWHVLAVFLLGVVLMRSAGCVINDYADRGFDPHVERTRDRPVASGRVAPRAALLLFAALCLVAFVLVLTLNRLTIALSIVGSFLAASYPFLKRYTHLPQFYLGAAFGWSIPMAFAAQTGTVPPLAWVIFAANVCWSVAYDTAYAMVDRDDDLRIGVKSTAILFGRHDRFFVAVFHVLTIVLLTAAGYMSDRGILYYVGLMAAGVTAGLQQVRMLDRRRDSAFRAFLDNNRFGACVFLGLIIDYYR